MLFTGGCGGGDGGGGGGGGGGALLVQKVISHSTQENTHGSQPLLPIHYHVSVAIRLISSNHPAQAVCVERYLLGRCVVWKLSQGNNVGEKLGKLRRSPAVATLEDWHAKSTTVH